MRSEIAVMPVHVPYTNTDIVCEFVYIQILALIALT
jgi:hypothetical protein